MCLLSTWVFYFSEISFQIFATCWLGYLSYCWITGVLNVFWIHISFQVCFANISLRLCFIFLTATFKEQLFFFSFWWNSIYHFFLFIVYAPCVLFRKSLLNLMSQAFFSCSFGQYVVSVFTFRIRYTLSYILYALWDKIWDSFFFPYRCSVVPALLVKELFFPPMNYFGNLII